MIWIRAICMQPCTETFIETFYRLRDVEDMRRFIYDRKDRAPVSISPATEDEVERVLANPRGMLRRVRVDTEGKVWCVELLRQTGEKEGNA